jgi:hypothetical protein
VRRGERWKEEEKGRGRMEGDDRRWRGVRDKERGDGGGG